MLEVQIAGSATEFDAALALRYEVFCEEQGVAREIELDTGDAVATHVLARQDGGVVATGRVLRQRQDGSEAALGDPANPGDCARVGRMAVARSWRGRGVGDAVLSTLERLAAQAGLGEVFLHAQLHAQGFYAQAGYAPRGEAFDEAGIAHVEMTKRLPVPEKR